MPPSNKVYNLDNVDTSSSHQKLDLIRRIQSEGGKLTVLLGSHYVFGRHKDHSVLVNWDGTPIDMAADSPVHMRSYFRDPNDSSGCQRLKIRSWHYLDELDSNYIRELGERYKDKIDIPFYGIHKGTGDETPGGKSDLALYPEQGS